MAEPNFPVSFAILAGGKSARLGRDKAMIRLVPDDKPLLGVVIERVRSLTDDLFVVASYRPEYQMFDVRVEDDDFPEMGPLGGIATALRVASHSRCFVLSCDHPFLSVPLLTYMLECDGEWGALVPAIPGSSRQGGSVVLQTLHSIYSKTALDSARKALSDGRLKTISFLADVEVRELGPELLVSFDREFRSFYSVNTPEALAQASLWRAEEIRFARENVD